MYTKNIRTHITLSWNARRNYELICLSLHLLGRPSCAFDCVPLIFDQDVLYT